MSYDLIDIFPDLNKFISSAIDATNFSNERIEHIKNKNIHHTDIRDVLLPINTILKLLLPDRVIPSNPGRVELEWMFEDYRLRVEIVPNKERYNFKIVPLNINYRGEYGVLNNSNELIIFLFKHIIGVEEVERIERGRKKPLCVTRAKDLPML